jgi:hypothetical protein
MTTFAYEGEHRFYFGAQAVLLDQSREMASEWAQGHILLNDAHAFVLGKFVEAERANNNKQYFTLEGLQVARPTIVNAPMNLNHSATIVGSFVATEMIYPAGESADSQEVLNPYIETLGCFWRYYFPEAYQVVKAAHSSGDLFYSMEAVPASISSIGGVDDSIEYPYEGRTSPSYSDDINERSCTAIKLNQPHFVGGALIIPPVKPGWSRADITQVSELMKNKFAEAELAYESIAEATPHLDARTWEMVMAELLLLDYEAEEARDFNEKQRKGMAKKGHAMPDGSFPIGNEGDLHNAIKLAGNAKDPAKARAHIKARAKAMGKSDLIPDSWG